MEKYNLLMKLQRVWNYCTDMLGFEPAIDAIEKAVERSGDKKLRVAMDTLEEALKRLPLETDFNAWPTQEVFDYSSLTSRNARRIPIPGAPSFPRIT